MLDLGALHFLRPWWLLGLVPAVLLTSRACSLRRPHSPFSVCPFSHEHSRVSTPVHKHRCPGWILDEDRVTLPYIHHNGGRNRRPARRSR